jgi:hypothetical protein
VKNTLAPDIYIMGCSIVEQAPFKDLDTIFVDVAEAESPNIHTSTDITEIAELLQVVSNLCVKISAIETELIVLRRDNLKVQEPCQCRCVSKNDNHLVPKTSI